MNLRQAVADDLKAVEDLTRRAYQHYVPIIGAKPMPMTEDYSPRIAAGEVWLLEDGADAAGLIVLEERDDELLVYSVAVDPDRQHRGLGRQLLAFAEKTARERGFPTLALFTNAKMERNVAIYRRLGFLEARRRVHPTRAGFVIVDMKKTLGAAEKRRSA